MVIYIVVAQHEDGRREERAFAFHRAARAYATARGAAAGTSILEVPVVGELASPGIAYTIRWNDGCEDTENTEAVYGNDLLARFAVGGHGRVEQLQIDLSVDAAYAIMSRALRAGRNAGDFRQAMAGMRQNRAQRMRRLT